jgi:hypothetical protein
MASNVRFRYKWRLKGCKRCGGDQWKEDIDWSCLQCGDTIYANVKKEESNLFLRIPVAVGPGNSAMSKYAK